MTRKMAEELGKAYGEQLTEIGRTLVRHGLVTRRAIRLDGVQFALQHTLDGTYLQGVASGTLPEALLPNRLRIVAQTLGSPPQPARRP